MNLAPYVRAAYAIGWAESGADVTELAKDQCSWLMAHADDPNVVEVSRAFARAAGRWTYHNTRRDALFTRFQLAQKPLLTRLAKAAAPKLARKFTPHEDDFQDETIKVLRTNFNKPEWQSLLQEAWINAKAEGNTQAMAMIAAAKNMPTVSMDVEFPKFLDALKNLGGQFALEADSWINKQLEGLAYYVAQDVGTALANGATYDDLLSLISDTIDSGDATDLTLDLMLSTGVTQGTLDQYGEEGVTAVDILISPDACEECSDLESENPWPYEEADGLLPVHFNCRCAIAPHF